jgi:hypothetical protein
MKYKIIKFNCRCVAGKDCDKLQVQDFGDKEIMFDIKRGEDYYGVVLNKKDVKRLIEFLSHPLIYLK